MVRRLRINVYSGVRNALAPVHRRRLHIGHGAANDRVIAEWRHDTRPMLRTQPPERSYIEMIIMIVRYQHEINWRQIIEGDARLDDAPGSGKSEGARAL